MKDRSISSNLTSYVWQEHWKELKWRSLYLCVSIVCVGYLSILNAESLIRWSWQHIKDQELIYTEITEGLWTYLSIASYMSIYLSIPFILYSIYEFMKPGLTQQESKDLKRYLILSMVLLVFSVYLSLTLLLPRATLYLLNFQSIDSGTTLVYLGKVNSWVSFVISVVWYLSIGLQLPILGVLFLKVTKKEITKVITPLFRKILLFSLSVISAMMSPPDVVSLFIFLVPMVILIEIFVFVWLIMEEWGSARVWPMGSVC